MKNFEYVAPKTVREAGKVLSANGKEARVLAGGTDLIVQMRIGRRQPERVIDIKNIPELNELSFSPRRGLVIGAAVACHTLYENAEVVERYPGLIDTVSIVGGIQIQGRGGDIRENDSRAADAGAGCRADEGERRRDDLVARPHSQRHHAQVEGGAAGVHRHCFCRIFVTGQCILKVGFLRQGKGRGKLEDC